VQPPKKRIVLITGPPDNGRDEYIESALQKLRNHGRIGYYHVFHYMQKNAPSCGISNLKRENVFDISKAKLDEIRDKAFSQIVEEIKNSSNDIDLVSTPSVFKTRIGGDYYDGKVEGLNVEIMKKLDPSLLVFFIDNLVTVRRRVKKDALRANLGLRMKDIAEWRESSLKIVEGYFYEAKSKTKAESCPLVFMIFAREHPISTFVDLVLGNKPRIYLSYHITGQGDFKDIRRFMGKLNKSFVCIDPYAIKDWQIVTAYDEAIEKNKNIVNVITKRTDGKVTIDGLSLDETKEAIDLIRSQIVHRDLEIIANAHATVVYHKSKEPSYGVMVEIFHSRMRVERPVYVLYPFKARLSPFFEQFVERENMIQGDKDVRKMEDTLVSKLEKEYKNWPTLSSVRDI
jgi:adenylate kinase